MSCRHFLWHLQRSQTIWDLCNPSTNSEFIKSHLPAVILIYIYPQSLTMKTLEITPFRKNWEFLKAASRFCDFNQAVAFIHSKGIMHRDLKPVPLAVQLVGDLMIWCTKIRLIPSPTYTILLKYHWLEWSEYGTHAIKSVVSFGNSTFGTNKKTLAPIDEMIFSGAPTRQVFMSSKFPSFGVLKSKKKGGKSI